MKKSGTGAGELDKILVLDFGSQYTQLIARRVREQRVYCEILPCDAEDEKIRAFAPRGIILSGGPTGVYAKDAPTCSRLTFEMGVPVLGICYGLQLLAKISGGEVSASAHREYGRAKLTIEDDSDLFKGFDPAVAAEVWMSHGDRVDSLPDGFSVLAHSNNSPFAAVADKSR